MKILFVTSEFADLIKTGGLADVSAALPRALGRRGLDVRVLLPAFPDVLAKAGRLTVVASLPGRGAVPPCLIGEARALDGVRLYLVLSPELYQRAGSVYMDAAGADFADNDLRFARLSLAAAQIAAGAASLHWTPDLVHAHDWPAGLAPAYMKWDGVATPSVMTIHNLAYQGVFPGDRMPALAIPDWSFQVNGLEFYGQVSFLKAGIYYADHVTTVSPTYAREVTGMLHGAGLQGLIAGLAAERRFSGIINGIDPEWDPACDTCLDETFGPKDLDGKAATARAVRAQLGLKPSNGPLFALVSRLVHQKGVDLVIEAAGDLVRRGGQIAVLGTGDPRFKQALQELVRLHPGEISLKLGFSEIMAHRIIAASDFYLMPSRFEPCGLTQMYAQAYGSLPVANATGGLADTVEDGLTGFLFSNYSLQGLLDACARAFGLYGDKRALARMRRAAMTCDFGWDIPAHTYETLYRRLTGIAPPAPEAGAAAAAPAVARRAAAPRRTLRLPASALPASPGFA